MRVAEDPLETVSTPPERDGERECVCVCGDGHYTNEKREDFKMTVVKEEVIIQTPKQEKEKVCETQ